MEKFKELLQEYEQATTDLAYQLHSPSPLYEGCDRVELQKTFAESKTALVHYAIKLKG